MVWHYHLFQRVSNGFVGCVRNFLQRGKPIGKWSKNQKVVPCSDKVEPGFFVGEQGGSIMAFKKFRVGLDFDITMKVKPRKISGILLAVQGRRDYLILQMVNGTMTFTVDNGRGPITTIFRPGDKFEFCDGQWHEVHGENCYNVALKVKYDYRAQCTKFPLTWMLLKQTKWSKI